MKMPREIAPQFVFFRMTVPASAYSCSAPISQNQCLGVSNDGNVLYLVRSGDPLLPLGLFSREPQRRGRRRAGRCPVRSGAEPFHGRHPLPLERRHGDSECLRPVPPHRRAVPSAAAPPAAQRQPGRRNAGGSLRQCLREPSGPWQRRHAAGHPSRPADGPKLRWHCQ